MLTTKRMWFNPFKKKKKTILSVSYSLLLTKHMLNNTKQGET